MTGTFFIIIQPGLEEVLASELQQKYPSVIDYKIEKGGVEVVCDLATGYSFNKYLKTSTRVLLRLKHFTCRDLPKLFQQTSKIPWNQYLLDGKFALEVACSGSRLNNEKRVAKAVTDGILTYLKGNQPKKTTAVYTHNIFVRIHNDHCQISIDTSGEALYKRTKKQVGEASIRESIAAALLQVLLQNQTTDFDLVDPMCGSGTFLQEALEWNQFRDGFAYQQFPTSKGLIEPKVELKPLKVAVALGNDKSKEATQIATENLSSHSNVSITTSDIKDFFKTIKVKNPVIICNLPYGKRLQVDQKDLKSWVGQIQKSSKTWGILVPKSLEVNGAAHLEFRNGGIPVRFYYKL